MKIFFRFWDNCLITILISKLSFIFSPIFLPNTPGKLKNQKMVSIVSRTGRQFQRYNQGCRQVVGWVSTFSLFFLSFCFLGFFFFFFLFSFLGNCGFDLDTSRWVFVKWIDIFYFEIFFQLGHFWWFWWDFLFSFMEKFSSRKWRRIKESLKPFLLPFFH